MLDVMSGGRLVAGFPVGTPQDTVFAYGQSPATLREKYREGVQLVLRAWQEPDTFSFNGKYTQLRYVNVWPRPAQRPRPPVWVPGGASVETWDWCVENDFLYANLSYFGYQEAQKVLDGFWKSVKRHNAERNPYRAGFLQFVGVADSDAEAEDQGPQDRSSHLAPLGHYCYESARARGLPFPGIEVFRSPHAAPTNYSSR